VYSEQINNQYYPEHSVTIIRPGKIRLVVYAERMGKVTSVYRFLGSKRHADKQHYRVMLQSQFGSGRGLEAGCCEHGNEHRVL
jgi:hypothetical protein